MPDTPSALGYRMPAEWEKHSATWLSWPKDKDTFPANILPSVEEAYVRMVRALAGGEDVWIMVDDEKTESRVTSMLMGVSRVRFHRIKTVDVWVRDYCPIYVKGNGLAVVKWKFNAWGDKYADLKPDDEAGERVARFTGLKVFSPGVVLEGGSIDVNGSGSLLTTEQCLLNPNRNRGMSRAELETVLREYLGVRNVIWLKDGIAGDDTDGHIDDIARFTGPRSVLVATEPNLKDSNHGVLSADREALKSALDEKDRPLEVTEIPMPPTVSSPDGRLPASHLNFYIGNEVILLPTFGGQSDKEAARTLGRLFPSREVVGIDCRTLVYGLGTLHCVTQQVPAID